MRVPVRARLLGPPEVEVEGEPLRVDTRRAVALLAYLVVEGSASRDVAAALLWPSSDEAHAKAALRRTLSALRRGLAGHAVSADRVRIRLDPSDVWSDVGLVLAATPGHDADPPALVALRRGPLLEGVALRDAGPFEAWLRDTQHALDQRLARVLDASIEEAVADGDWNTAEVWTQARLRLDPLHERTHRRSMWLAARRGDRDAAVAAYRHCVAVLRDELGVSPDRRTTALHETVVAGEVSAEAPSEGPATIPAGRASTDQAPAPLVGRDGLLAGVSAALADAAHGGAAVIEGAPGMGKSRLLTESARLAVAAGRLVAATTAYLDERHLPFAPIVDLLTQLEPPPSAAVATVAPHLVAGTTPLDAASPGGRASLVAGLWAALAAAPGTVLLVDDAQWADASTLEVLTHGLRRLEQHDAFLVMAHDHTARRVLDAAVRDAGPRAVHHTLGPLDEQAMGRLVAHRGGDVDAATLRSRTGGIPALVVAALDRRPDRLGAAVDRLLRGYDSGALRLLSVLAVSGRPLPSDVLARVAGLDPEPVAHALNWLDAAGTVDETTAGHVLPQVSIRQALLDRLGAEQRRSIHHRLADDLRGRPGQEAILAAHLHAAGRLAEAATAHVAAARRATRLGAWEEAGHHYDVAIASGHPDRRDLLRQRGDIDALRGRYQEAQEAYAAALADAASSQEQALLEHRLGRLQLRRGAWQAARVHLRAARRHGGTRPDLEVDLALASWHLGETDQALARARGALATATQAGDSAGTITAHNFLGLAARREGSPRRAVEHLEAGLELAAGPTDARLALLNNLGLALADLGATNEARAVFEEAARIARGRGDLHREAGVLNNLADLAHTDGEAGEARRLQRDAVTLFALVGDTVLDPEIWRLVDW